MDLHIARLVTILVAVALYIIALISIFRKPKRIKLHTFDETPKKQDDYEGPERRIFARIRLGIEIRYKIEGAGITVFKEGRSRDFSEGGILMETHEKLPADARLGLKLKLPNKAHYTLVRGKVVWIKEVKVDEWYHCGISFIEIDSNDKKTFTKYIEEVQKIAE